MSAKVGDTEKERWRKLADRVLVAENDVFKEKTDVVILVHEPFLLMPKQGTGEGKKKRYERFRAHISIMESDTFGTMGGQRLEQHEKDVAYIANADRTMWSTLTSAAKKILPAGCKTFLFEIFCSAMILTALKGGRMGCEHTQRIATCLHR